MCVYVCACMRVCVRACVCVFVCVCELFHRKLIPSPLPIFSVHLALRANDQVRRFTNIHVYYITFGAASKRKESLTAPDSQDRGISTSMAQRHHRTQMFIRSETVFAGFRSK